MIDHLEKRKEHMRRAAEMLAKKKAEEAIKDAEYYKKITTGNRWTLFAIGVFICLIINVIATIDTFVDGETVKLPSGSFYHERLPYSKANALVIVDQDIFTPYYKDFISVDFESFTMTNSLLFGQAKFIEFDAHTLGDRQRFIAYERISIFEWFPYLQIMLLIPLFTFLMKRQAPWFIFMRYLCLLIIFPGSLVMLYFQLG